jgi:hypothetical protein
MFVAPRPGLVPFLRAVSGAGLVKGEGPLEPGRQGQLIMATGRASVAETKVAGGQYCGVMPPGRRSPSHQLRRELSSSHQLTLDIPGEPGGKMVVTDGKSKTWS